MKSIFAQVLTSLLLALALAQTPNVLNVSKDEVSGSRYILSAYKSADQCLTTAGEILTSWTTRTQQLWVKTVTSSSTEESTRDTGLNGETIFNAASGILTVYEGGVYELSAKVNCNSMNCDVSIKVNGVTVSNAYTVGQSYYQRRTAATSVNVVLKPNDEVTLFLEYGCANKDTQFEALLYMPDGTRP